MDEHVKLLLDALKSQSKAIEMQHEVILVLDKRTQRLEAQVKALLEIADAIAGRKS